jgi:hypothetical protein
MLEIDRGVKDIATINHSKEIIEFQIFYASIERLDISMHEFNRL